MKLKKISNSIRNKNYKINIILNSYNKNDFFVGDKVKNNSYDLFGRISQIDDNNIMVTYEDKTIERFNKKDAHEVLSYVDDVQSVIDPLSSQISNNAINKVISNLSKANEVFENKPIEANKHKMRIEQEYEQLKMEKEKNKKINKIDDLIHLAISKGMIDKDDFEIEKTKLSMMNERDYHEYEDEVINFNSKSIVTSALDEKEDPNLTDAEKALKRIKSGDNVVASSIDYNKINDGARSIESLSYKPNNNIPLNNMNESYNEYSYNKNNWMDQLDWTTLSKN